MNQRIRAREVRVILAASGQQLGVMKIQDALRAAQQAGLDLVVGFNVINFDYEVLAGYTVLDLAHTARTLDLMVEVEKRLGHRLGLDAIASATLGVGKTGDGLDAIRWWREGKLLDIAEYCCFDVKCTKLVHEHGAKHKKLHFVDKFRNRRTVEVGWS